MAGDAIAAEVCRSGKIVVKGKKGKNHGKGREGKEICGKKREKEREKIRETKGNF